MAPRDLLFTPETGETGTALDVSLDILDQIRQAGLVITPARATVKMTEAGARVGEISHRKASVVYSAMVAADD